MNLHVVIAGLRALSVPLIVAAVLSMFTYALTAGNVVAGSNVGSGVAAVAGYTVTAVEYDLNDTDPQKVDSVSFTISPAPPANSDIRAKLVPTETVYYTCTPAGGSATVTCPTTAPQATAVSATELTVVIG